jgi:hypothetical protein
VNTVNWLARQPERSRAEPRRQALGLQQFYVSAEQGTRSSGPRRWPSRRSSRWSVSRSSPAGGGADGALASGRPRLRGPRRARGGILAGRATAPGARGRGPAGTTALPSRAPADGRARGPAHARRPDGGLPARGRRLDGRRAGGDRHTDLFDRRVRERARRGGGDHAARPRERRLGLGRARRGSSFAGRPGKRSS